MPVPFAEAWEAIWSAFGYDISPLEDDDRNAIYAAMDAAPRGERAGAAILEVARIAVRDGWMEWLSLDDNEQWRDVPGFEGFYRISTSGELLRIKTGQSLKWIYDNSKRRCKDLWHPVKKTTIRIFFDEVIREAFTPPPPPSA